MPTEGLMDRPLKLAAVQLDTVAMEVNHNVHKAMHWARRAFESGATHVFFHEGLTADYSPDPVRFGRPLHSHEVFGFVRLAERYDGTVALGLNEVFEGRPYISCVYVSKRGIDGVYRKSYLWPHEYTGQGVEAAFWRTGDPSEAKTRPVLTGEWPPYRRGYRQERGIIAPGEGTKNVRVGDLTIGTLICADAEHPAAWETFRREVPDLIFFQANSSGGAGSSLRACQDVARTLGVPMVATNRAGFSYASWMKGGSFLLADDGTVVAQANEQGEEEVVYADWSALTPGRHRTPAAHAGATGPVSRGTSERAGAKA
jgi:predicted amidohydrolase